MINDTNTSIINYVAANSSLFNSIIPKNLIYYRLCV